MIRSVFPLQKKENRFSYVHIFLTLQYSQPWRRHRLGKKLWTLNVVGRVLLNKLSAGWIPGPAALTVYRKPHLSFRAVMRRADLLTLCFRITLAILFWKVVGTKITLPRFI